MRLVTFEHDGSLGRVRRLGALVGNPDRVVDLQIAYLAVLAAQKIEPKEAQRMAEANVPSRMERFISGGKASMAAAKQAMDFASDPAASVTGPGGRMGILGLDEVKLLSPLTSANSLRDFIAFEDHAKAGAARRGEDLNPIWYERPVYYKGNHRSLLGPDENLRRPSFTTELDFELEVACIVGEKIIDADEKKAAAAIFGFTIMNDWSARDVQRAEMSARLGPAKSKDFATSLGPCILTADETGPEPSLAMTAKINGDLICTADLGDIHWKFAQMISFVSQSETVWPTDVYGSGTPFGGCLLDQGRPYLENGDVVTLEVARIGTLSNTVG